jgi:charged multivesicular body protein 7
LIGRPLWWALSQLNPFGGGEENVKEDVVWGKYGKGREYVHMPLLDVRPLFCSPLLGP